MTDRHTVSAFDDDLADIARLVIELGNRATTLTRKSITALASVDPILADEVISGDQRIDALQREAEEKAIRVMARRQPVARDLREIVAVIRISNDFERIGDLAKNIAKRVLALNGLFQPAQLIRGVEAMAALTCEQLTDVLDAYTAMDVAKADLVWARDQEVDALYTALFRELLTYMMEDPRNITLCTHLLFCAKNIERIGDHATNVAETIHYVVTGANLPTDRPKNDVLARSAEVATQG